MSKELCCIVNGAKCRLCNKPKCDDHSFECADCGTVCVSCNKGSLAQICSRCGMSICRRCARNAPMGDTVCSICLDDIMDDGMNATYDEDWLKDEYH